MARLSERARGRLIVGGGLFLVVILAAAVVLSELAKRRADAKEAEVIKVETRDVEEQGSTAKDILNGFAIGQVLDKPQPRSTGRQTPATGASGEPVFVLADQTKDAAAVEPEENPFLAAQDEIDKLRARELVDAYVKRRDLRIAADEGSLSIETSGSAFGGGTSGDGAARNGIQQLASAIGGGVPSQSTGAGRTSGIGAGQGSLSGRSTTDIPVNGPTQAQSQSSVATVVGYAQNPPYAPLSRYELKKGSVIPAVLLTELVSDNPGIAIGQTTLPVFDTVTGRHELIPAGSKLHGRYGSDVSFGTERIGVVWTHLVFPDGRTLNLENAQGAGPNGASGLKDQVDTRFWETVGVALLTSVIGVGVEVLSPPRSDEERLADELRRGLGQNVGGALDEYVRKQANLAPRITIRTGARFNVIVENDFIVPPVR